MRDQGDDVHLYLGDNLEILQNMPKNSVHSVVTDPPYGLAFMGKKWDYDVPDVNLWIQVLRVLRPGGHLLSFGGTRTYHRMAVNIEDAGFEIRDQLQWLYGSGFPKSHNISKKIIDRDQSKDGCLTAQYWEGFGTALKPSNEPIVLARKPLSEKTVVDNVLKWGCGALNIDGCRIETDWNTDTTRRGWQGKIDSSSTNQCDRKQNFKNPNSQGRWPANTLFDHAAAQILDDQSGLLRARNGYGKKGQTGGGTGHCYTMTKCSAEKSQKVIREGENGVKAGASRFFYVAKASKSERNAGLEDLPCKELSRSNSAKAGNEHEGDGFNKIYTVKNNHPTVKPVKLMEYLCRLITPPQGIVLDPFMGSGSTGIASKNEGFDFIGIEMEPDYFEIAQKRIEG